MLASFPHPLFSTGRPSSFLKSSYLLLYFQNALFVASWHRISLVSLVDGTLLASHTLPCQPVSPVVEGDFTNDGLTDFVVQCSDR